MTSILILETMEAVQLLSFTLAIITVSLAQHRRRRSTARSLRQPTIKIRGAVARRALINQANVSIYCLVDILINRHKNHVVSKLEEP